MQNTDYRIEENLFTSSFLLEICKKSKRRVVILTDERVAQKGAERLRIHLGAELLSIEAGEAGKTRENKEKIEDALLQRKFNRDTLIIGMGGGSLTDLVGFVASTYMRGVPLIFIPTTLLGMVDAAFGGKNGVNTPLGKNLIGTIYPPLHVFIDLQLLKTLPQKEWLNGLAEILKYGLISDRGIWDLCTQHPKSWQTPPHLSSLILSSIGAKMGVLKEDPEEMGKRRILNFGHTVGHGLESLSHFQMSHGEAVAIGSMAESWLSSHLGYLSKETLSKILTLYHQCGFSTRLPQNFSRERFRESLERDKKTCEGKPRYVLIEDLGRPLPFGGSFCTPIGEKEFEALVDWMEQMGGR